MHCERVGRWMSVVSITATYMSDQDMVEVSFLAVGFMSLVFIASH